LDDWNNFRKFSQLILIKVIKTVATRCQILRLKFIKFNLGWGSSPDPAWGAYSAPPDPLGGFKGPFLRGGEGKEKVEGSPLLFFCGSTPMLIGHSWAKYYVCI